jgi:hypothetical protein
MSLRNCDGNSLASKAESGLFIAIQQLILQSRLLQEIYDTYPTNEIYQAIGTLNQSIETLTTLQKIK